VLSAAIFHTYLLRPPFVGAPADPTAAVGLPAKDSAAAGVSARNPGLSRVALAKENQPFPQNSDHDSPDHSAPMAG